MNALKYLVVALIGIMNLYPALELTRIINNYAIVNNHWPEIPVYWFYTEIALIWLFYFGAIVALLVFLRPKKGILSM